MGLVRSRQLVFFNAVSQGRIEKVCYSGSRNWLSGYLNRYDDIAVIDEVVGMIELAMTGKYDQIVDPDIGMDFYEIAIGASEIVVSMEPGGRQLETLNLSEFRDLMLAWKDFLQSPPFDGSPC